MNDLLQQSKFCAKNFKQCDVENGELIGSLDSTVVLLVPQHLMCRGRYLFCQMLCDFLPIHFAGIYPTSKQGI